MPAKTTARIARFQRVIISALVTAVLCLTFNGVFGCTAYAASSPSSQSSAASTQRIPADSAGTAFSADSQLANRSVSGDLFWGNSRLQAQGLSVGKDLIGAADSLATQSSQIGGDLRFAGRMLQLDQLKVGGSATVLGQSVSVGSESQMRGLYVGAGDLDYRGTAHYVAAYANSIYFDGTVDGNVTLSAQDIEIGPHAKVTGTLNVRSGQTPQVPSTAHIASIDTSLNNPNAIDLVSQARSKIAPYFQLGSILFIVVASIVMALLLLWVGERQLYEAHRVLRRRPFGQILLGVLAVVVLVVATIVCLALVLTIPAGLALLFLLLAAGLVCVPFTGASLGLALGRFPRTVRAVLGAGIAGVLLCVPYVQWAVFAFSLVYLIGYLTRSLFVGHDAAYLESLKAHHRKSPSAHAAEGHPASDDARTVSTPASCQVPPDESSGADETADCPHTEGRESESDASQPAGRKAASPDRPLQSPSDSTDKR